MEVRTLTAVRSVPPSAVEPSPSRPDPATHTSVSGEQLNDDDHCFHLSKLNLKKCACALKRTARAVAGNSIKEKCFYMYCQWLPKKNVMSVVANRRRAGIALLRILWKT